MAASPIPQPGQQQDQQQGQQQTDPLQDFRALGQQVKSLADKYPEFTESATVMLREIQKGMVRVAGNPQRTQEQPAPPVA